MAKQAPQPVDEPTLERHKSEGLLPEHRTRVRRKERQRDTTTSRS